MHRLSFELDITIPTGGSRHTEQAVLDAIETKLRKRGLDVINNPAERLLRAKTGVVDNYGNKSGIDIRVHDPGLPGSARAEPISGTSVNRLSVAQITHSKLQRDQMSLVRDAYDIQLRPPGRPSSPRGVAAHRTRAGRARRIAHPLRRAHLLPGRHGPLRRRGCRCPTLASVMPPRSAA